MDATGGAPRTEESPLGDWPLVGREIEIDFLLRTIGRNPVGVVVSGEIGVGKTRLAAAVAERLRAEGWSVTHHVATVARASIPFAPFAPLLDAAATSPDPLQRLVDATARLAGGPRQRVALHVDDAQWLDGESWAFLHHVTEAAGATVLLTARATDPRMAEVAAASRSMGMARLELLPLSRVEVDALLRATLPGQTSAQRHELWKLTQGNPLYLHEAVTRAQERGTTDALAVIQGAGLDAVVDARLDDLGPEHRRVLELVAVGGLAPVDLLRARSSDAVLADLEQRRLLVVEEAGRRLMAQLAHPIYAEVVAARMGKAARLARRRELLEELVRHASRRQSDLVQIAVWGVEQGDAVDPAVLLRVAQRLSGYTHETSPGSGPVLPPLQGDLLAIAARLAKAAVDGGGGFDAARCWFGIEAHIDGRSAETADALARMDGLAVTDEQKALTATSAATLRVLSGWQSPDETVAELEGLQATAEGATWGVVGSVLAMTMSLFGRYQEAADVGRRVLTDPLTTPRDRLVAAGPVIGSLAVLGHSTEALALSDQAIVAVPPEADQWSLGVLVYARIAALAANGLIPEAEAFAAQMASVAESAGNTLGMVLFGMSHAQMGLERGRPRDALDAVAVALAAGPGPQEGGPSHHAALHALAAHAHALLGDRRQASSSLEASEAVASRTRLFDVVGAQSRAWVAVVEGRHRAAVATLRGVIGGESNNRHGVMSCLHDLARLGERGCGAEMQRLVDGGVDGDRWAACTAHAVAFDAGDGAALDAASDDFVRIGMTLVAAEAAAQAANAHRNAGNRALAAASTASSRRHAAECQGASTPALVVEGDAATLLTRREFEVAQLAARGATDRAIADELGLSLRTVETYMHRVYFKLGVSGRTDLATYVGL